MAWDDHPWLPYGLQVFWDGLIAVRSERYPLEDEPHALRDFDPIRLDGRA